MDKIKLIEFVQPYYEDKDIMHNMWHIELVEKWVSKILDMTSYEINLEHLTFATYFHGFIYSHENDVRSWLSEQGFPEEEICQIVKIAYESQRAEVPESIEGKILHDAHLLEGGKVYMVTKCLITGSIRGQTLLETIKYIESNILNKSMCYLPGSSELFKQANLFAEDFIAELKQGILIDQHMK
ncbi:MAG: hypothetical protein FWE07_01465 [Turicibacter sp.]|nr:hypothetical protein [Turicibacter sp.]